MLLIISGRPGRMHSDPTIWYCHINYQNLRLLLLLQIVKLEKRYTATKKWHSQISLKKEIGDPLCKKPDFMWLTFIFHGKKGKENLIMFFAFLGNHETFLVKNYTILYASYRNCSLYFPSISNIYYYKEKGYVAARDGASIII